VASSLCRDVVVASSRFATTFATTFAQYMCKDCIEQLSWRICVASVVAQYMCNDCVEQISWRANFDVTLSWRAHFSPRHLPRHVPRHVRLLCRADVYELQSLHQAKKRKAPKRHNFFLLLIRCRSTLPFILPARRRCSPVYVRCIC